MPEIKPPAIPGPLTPQRPSISPPPWPGQSPGPQQMPVERREGNKGGPERKA